MNSNVETEKLNCFKMLLFILTHKFGKVDEVDNFLENYNLAKLIRIESN